MRVSDVLDLLAAGESRMGILEDYPYLNDEDITAANLYPHVGKLIGREGNRTEEESRAGELVLVGRALQQLDNLGPLAPVEDCGLAILIFQLRIGSGFQEVLHQIQITLRCREHQGRLTALRLRIHVRSGFEQQFDNLLGPGVRGDAERRGEV